MARGGARPGAGRRKGSGDGRAKPESKSKEIALIREEIAAGPPPPPEPETGPDPVEPGEDDIVEGVRTRDVTPELVMHSNMAWWYRMSLRLRRKAHQALGQNTDEGRALFSDLMKEAERCMLMAGGTAKELAPYKMAKLSATVPLPPPGDEEKAKANTPIGPGADHLETVLNRFKPHVLKVHQGGKS